MNKKLALTLTAVILALVLRWYASINLPTDYDESVYFTAARYYADAIRTREWNRIPEITFNYEHPGFAKLLYGAVLANFPSDGPVTDDVWVYFGNLMPLEKTSTPFRILVLRQLSVGFGTLQVLALSLFSPGAALLLAIDSMDIKYTSVIYLEALPAFLAMVSILLFHRAAGWLSTKEKISLPGHFPEMLWIALSGISLGMAVASKYPYAVAGVAILLFSFVWIVLPRPTDWTRYLVLGGFAVVVIGAFVAADPYVWPAPLQRFYHSIHFSFGYSQSEPVKQAEYPFYQPLVWLSKSVPDQPRSAVPITGNEFIFRLDTLIAVLALLGLPKLFRENKLLFLWLATGIFFLLLWSTKWPQYSLIVLGPLCIAASEGVKTAANLIRKILPSVWPWRKAAP
jgi:hypothetical protein